VGALFTSSGPGVYSNSRQHLPNVTFAVVGGILVKLASAIHKVAKYDYHLKFEF